MVPFGAIRLHRIHRQCFLDRYFIIRDAGLKDTQFCCTHTDRRFCPLQTVKIDIEIGGFPCQPNSRMGQGLKEEDDRFTCFITWSFDLQRRDVTVAILENTKDTTTIIFQVY